MSKENGGPAFPSHGSMGEVVQEGMTLRDYFAVHASDEDVKTQLGIMRLSNELGIVPDNWPSTARYMHADAMLAERSKP